MGLGLLMRTLEVQVHDTLQKEFGYFNHSLVISIAVPGGDSYNILRLHDE